MPSSFTEILEEPPKTVSIPPRSTNCPAPAPITSTGSGLEFADYHPPLSTVSDNKTTCTTAASQITSDPHVLYEFLHKQLRMPPRPVVRISGTHLDWCNSRGNTKVDFDLMMDITPLIYPATSSIDVAPSACCPIAAKTLATQVQEFCREDGYSKV